MMSLETGNIQERIGFMQGRLSPLVEGKIQAFPWDHWRDEFPTAQSRGLSLMEWTLDHDGLHNNPIMHVSGQREIRKLCEMHAVRISSITGDCFMQAPFWKASGATRTALEQDFRRVIEACAAYSIRILVLPLVDNGHIESRRQEDVLVDYLLDQTADFESKGIQVAFECDYPPSQLAHFIERLKPSCFGINYDIGNSAALGLDPEEEFTAFGERIVNVHVKDRLLGGATVPLGEGAAKFEIVFQKLSEIGYRGNYILQTARALDGNHAAALVRYRAMVLLWVTGAARSVPTKPDSLI